MWLHTKVLFNICKYNFPCDLKNLCFSGAVSYIRSQWVSGFHLGATVSVESGTAICELLQLWQKCGEKVSPSFVTAISVSRECDTRDAQAKKKYESDLWTRMVSVKKKPAQRVCQLHGQKENTQVSAGSQGKQTWQCSVGHVVNTKIQ